LLTFWATLYSKIDSIYLLFVYYVACEAASKSAFQRQRACFLHFSPISWRLGYRKMIIWRENKPARSVCRLLQMINESNKARCSGYKWDIQSRIQRRSAPATDGRSLYHVTTTIRLTDVDVFLKRYIPFITQLWVSRGCATFTESVGANSTICITTGIVTKPAEKILKRMS